MIDHLYFSVKVITPISVKCDQSTDIGFVKTVLFSLKIRNTFWFHFLDQNVPHNVGEEKTSGFVCHNFMSMPVCIMCLIFL